ncbi:IPT/TIG domain-containing protein [Actinomadura sp. 9N215]|uniref:IPT/TIG domain-containing protein n=1 Tax=Actinomadura sp. 9N215 TaxID=3375150 RepID=UPI0037B7240E
MPNFRASRRAAAVAATAAALLVAAPPPAHAASVLVSPTSGVSPAGQTLTVRGSGFDPARNNRFGVYVVFGPRGANWTSNSNAYLAAKWVHPGGSGGGQAPMSPSGGFSVTLSVKAKYTDGDGKKVDCLKTQCYVLTMAAHGVPDRSQDTSTPIRFKGSGSGAGPGTGSGGSAGAAGSGQGSAGSGSGTGAQGAPGASTPGGGASGTASPSATPDGASLDGASPAGAFEQSVSGGRAGSPWPFWAATAAAGAAALAARSVLRRRSGRSARRRDLDHIP